MTGTEDLRRVVIVGASLAGLRAAEAVRRLGFTGELTVVGEEKHLPYDRPPLSKTYLGGTVDREQLTLRQRSGLAVTWRLGQRAAALDGARRTVRLDSGEELAYDGLVVATGATPRRLPGAPAAAAGLHLLRTIDDAQALRDELIPGARVVIVGGGFIGAELASTARGLGLDVAVVTPLPFMAGALGRLSAAAATRARRHGVGLHEGVGVDAIELDTCRDGRSRVRGVRCDDGILLPADVVVVAIGVVPATDWLAGSGLKLDGGVVCDATLAAVGLDGVVAAGDIARWPHPALDGELVRLEHWTNAVEQGAAAASRLLRGPAAPAFGPVPSFWSDQFGIRLQGVGFPGRADEIEVIAGDPAGDRFVAEYRRAGRLVGAVCAGAVQELLPYRRRLATIPVR